MSINPQTLDAMLDRASVSAARGRYSDHCARQEQHGAAVEAARTALAAAISARDALLMSAARGETVPVPTAAAADTAVQQAEAHVRFVTDLAQKLETHKQQLDNELVAAQGAAALPIIRHGARQRQDAAGRIERLRADLAAAEADYDEANAIVQYGSGRGYRFVQQGTHEFASPFPPSGKRFDAATEARVWRSFGITLEPDEAKAA